jgi:hypothetical protein
VGVPGAGIGKNHLIARREAFHDLDRVH